MPVGIWHEGVRSSHRAIYKETCTLNEYNYSGGDSSQFTLSGAISLSYKSAKQSGGREIDMMIQNEDGLELSYCEFKPSHNSSMALYQRSKNLRLNQTIKLQMKKMGINDKIVSFNWEGSYGTFFVLEDCSQVMVARNANCLIIPSNPLALDDDFTMTVLSMIVWKILILNKSKINKVYKIHTKEIAAHHSISLTFRIRNGEVLSYLGHIHRHKTHKIIMDFKFN
ncbi:hypothetical protein BD560DRAFT_492392 [Blakeslea trispora]|nr:hypothetical protein BD560DRAFT_492392 [Blakeslea trispora]